MRRTRLPNSVARYCEVAPGRFVVAVGDAHVTNGPIYGQGANLASNSAAVLAEAICEDVAYDEWFCRGLAQKLWAVAGRRPSELRSQHGRGPPHRSCQAVCSSYRTWRDTSFADEQWLEVPFLCGLV